MHALIISDSSQISDIVRDVVLKQNYLCEPQDLFNLNSPGSSVPRDADLVVVHISLNPDRALALLSELRRATTARIIAVGPNGDAKLILRALRDGAEHYLDEGEIEQELRETLEQLHALRSRELHEPGRLICVIKPSGGSGCSSVAVNLAVLLAQQQKSCALVDFDFVTDDLTAMLDVKPTVTLAELSKYSTKMDRVVFERSLTRHASGVSLLAAPRMQEEPAPITAQCVREILDWACMLFPRVVVDMGHAFQEVKLEALKAADFILLVFRLDFTSIRNVKRTVDHLEANGIARERVMLVVNRYGQAKELSAPEAEGSLKMKIAYYLADDSRTANEANNKGNPMVLDSPRSKLSNGFIQLVKGLELVKAAVQNGAAR